MTKEEAMIVTAYTGILMVDVGEYREWLGKKKYADPFMALTTEHLNNLTKTLRKQVEADFLEICSKVTE